ENIYRHMKQGESPWTAALNGRAEIGAAAVAITLVDVVVYTPIAFSTGMTAQFFKEFSGAIVVATLFSLLVSFTLTPMLASRWLTADAEERSPLAPVWRRWEAGYEALEAGYRRILDRALRLRWLVLLVGFLAFVGGIALLAVGAVGSEFMTQSDQGMLSVSVEMPAGTSLSATNQAVEQLEEQMAKLPEMDSFISLVGQGGGQARSATIFASLKPRAQRSRGDGQVAEEIRRMAASIPGMKGQVLQASFVSFGTQAIQISVRGGDMAHLTSLAGQVEEIVRRTPGTIDVTNGAAVASPELRVEIDHQKLSDLGLTTAQVASALRTALDGTVATELRRENEDKVDIRVLYAPEAGSSQIASMPDIPLTSVRGTQVRLSQVAKVVPVEGPSEIGRVDRMRQVLVGANLSGTRPLGDVTAELQQSIQKLPLPAGYKVVMGGDAEAQADAFGSLGLAMLFSVVLMYMLMVALYNSLVYPLVIMGALPVASVGAIGALALTGDTLNIMSLVGLIMLTGLVAKNAILLVDYTNTLRAKGYSRLEALLEAGPTRLRPIIMTTAAMVFAMVPVALKIGEGAETRSPMGVVVIGGLLTSTLLTLVVVPAGYTVMDDLQRWVAARFGRRDETAKADEEKGQEHRERSPLYQTSAHPQKTLPMEAIRVRVEEE
ncbi:MAG: efflux RND transporter permease subunit, partial [Sphingomonadaceae bacterium]